MIELIGTPEMKDEVYSRLTSRDPSRFFTSGQWMTERPGGSDVGRTETQAVWDEEKKAWSISGFKWFSSATDADVTMLLARTHEPDPSVAPGTMQDGSRGLSLYLARVRDEEGKLNGVRIHRLKDKVGTKALPTAELELDGMVGQLVGQKYRGVKNISAILNITRIHCGLNCTSTMQTLLLRSKEYARRREVGLFILVFVRGYCLLWEVARRRKAYSGDILNLSFLVGVWRVAEGAAFASCDPCQYGASVQSHLPVYVLLRWLAGPY